MIDNQGIGGGWTMERNELRRVMRGMIRSGAMRMGVDGAARATARAFRMELERMSADRERRGPDDHQEMGAEVRR